MTNRESILNIGAGKGEPLNLSSLDNYFLVNIDPGYLEERSTKIITIEENHENWDNAYPVPSEVGKENIYCKYGWKDFIPNYFRKFDRVVIYSYLEHVPMVEVPFFLYMVSTIIKSGGTVEGIVPNYNLLAERILNENPFSPDFERENILTTTEVVNEPYDPHASIWTPQRIRYFFELENRFEIDRVVPQRTFDDRDIYIWFTAVRK